MSTAEISRRTVTSGLSLAGAALFALTACTRDPVAPSAPPCVVSAAPLAPAAPLWVPARQVIVSPAQLEAIHKGREAAEQRRREPHEPWTPSSIARWQGAIEGYVWSVKPNNQTALNGAAVPFASYLNGMHNRIHPLFADRFLDSLDDLPTRNRANDHHLVTRLEVVLTEEGKVTRMGVVKSSGVAEFDSGRLTPSTGPSPSDQPRAHYVRPTETFTSTGSSSAMRCSRAPRCTLVPSSSSRWRIPDVLTPAG